MGFYGTGPTESDQAHELYAECVMRGLAVLMMESNLEPEAHWLRIGAIIIAMRDHKIGIPKRWLKQLLTDVKYLQSIDFGSKFYDKKDSHQRWREDAEKVKNNLKLLLDKPIRPGHPDTIFRWSKDDKK